MHITTTTKGRTRLGLLGMPIPVRTRRNLVQVLLFSSILSVVTLTPCFNINGWLTGGPSSRDKMAQKPSADDGGHRNSFSCPIHVLHSPFHYWQRRSSLLSRFGAVMSGRRNFCLSRWRWAVTVDECQACQLPMNSKRRSYPTNTVGGQVQLMKVWPYSPSPPLSRKSRMSSAVTAEWQLSGVAVCRSDSK